MAIVWQSGTDLFHRHISAEDVYKEVRELYADSNPSEDRNLSGLFEVARPSKFLKRTPIHFQWG